MDETQENNRIHRLDLLPPRQVNVDGKNKTNKK